MAENKEMRNGNIRKANELLNDGSLSALCALISDTEKSAFLIKNAFSDKLSAFVKERKEKEEALKAEAAKTEEASKETVKEEVPATGTPLPEEKKPMAEASSGNSDSESKAEEAETVETVKNKSAEKEEAEKEKAAEPKAEEKKETSSVTENKEAVKTETVNKQTAAPEKKEFVVTETPRPSFIVRREGKESVRPTPKREYKPEYRQGQNGQRPPFNRNATGDARGERPAFNKKPRETYVAPPIVAGGNDKRNFGKKKQSSEKSYEEKHTLNKRALIKNQINVDDFDENKTGYRKFRPVKKEKKAEVNTVKIEKAVINTEIIPLKVLSEKIGVTAAEITKRLFKEGIMKTINDSIDFDTAAFIADDLGIELELKLEKSAEDVLSENFDETEDSANLVTRPPVVTVMGHVDHGKTSILDRIRKTNVTQGEAGGITQHIGAYQVTVGGKVITFLDTPGHAAFTAMRARGAQATDIAVLVVAADDGIMPQTIEAINHAKAANVPIIVAVNKIDKPEADIERIKTQLTDHGLLPEEWGGDVIICPVSAKTGEGIDNLLENINLVAEMADLKANPDRKAKGVVIEAKLDQSRGPVATILVQNGTLKVSDSVIVGTVTGKIRAMSDDKGRKVSSAGPSAPVSIMGLDEVPEAGDILYAVEQEKLTKLVAEERKNKEREKLIKDSQKVSLDDVFNRIAEGEIKGLNIIVKADVQGSVEAVKQSLEKLSNDEVKVNVIHAAAGAIKESDIMLAESSNAIIIGFNVRPDSNAKQVAEKSGVDIKLYRVIYEAIEDVQKALKGMLAPKFKEVYLGKAEVREVFKISGVGQVAGCYVTEGKILRSGKLRIYRDDVMICEGNVLQLKRFKDDVKEVSQGYECGISIEKFNDIKVGDFIESYQIEEENA
ncbi:MAG: translation initiation factor IF-2 [Candidatus Borkfalkiaceae bacterium]|nr:translation initiation factor IF-2 [Christensenellaceae bacterium]